MLDDDGTLIAFGQYYERLGRAHLARVAIHPDRRGQGIGEHFMQALMTEAVETLGLSELSLFVDEENPRVLPLYRRLGFVEQFYPIDDSAFATSLYMVAKHAAA